MEFQGKYNVKSPAVKRLMREACELKESTEEYWAHPIEDNLFEWHFTVQGPTATDFEGGVYHGRILLPTEYPMKPPNIILLTPNGRFETNKKICLSISGHHPETWQPSWSIRTALMALIAFMPTPGNGTIGSLDYTKDERQALARRSQSWECPTCGKIVLQLSSCASKPLTQEESALISQIALKAEEVRPDDKESEPLPAKTNIEEPNTLTEGSNEESSGLRHRVAHVDSAVDSNATPIVQTQVPETPIAAEESGDYKNVAMWFLILAIGFLIYRRLFLV